MEQEVLATLAAQVSAQSEIIKISVTLLTLFVALISISVGLLCKWVWDLKQKTSVSVSGIDCERRNNEQYRGVETLRKEIKEDFQKREQSLKDEFKAITDVMSTQLKQNHEVFVSLLNSLRQRG